MKKLFFGGSFFKIKIADILNFWWIKDLCEGLHLKNWGLGINCCSNYRPLKLLLHFIEYHLDQLNNKHMKIEVNSKIYSKINKLERKLSKIFESR